ncbi:MAG: DUF2085 domain-containing protein [Acidobacteriota bacterium]|nr:DUF2085 domain-containing protein [Acidobacteriota bacterium]
MSLSAENYISPGKTRKLDLEAWGATALFVLLWVGLIVASPVLKAAGSEVAGYIYAPFSYLCHQLSERSLHLAGEQLAVCSRCFGVYAGLAIGIWAYPFLRTISETDAPPRIVLFLAPVPTAIDWTLGLFGIWENTHWSRFLTAAVLGVVCAFFVVPGIVEINRFFRLKNKKKIEVNTAPPKTNSAPSDYSRPDLRI